MLEASLSSASSSEESFLFGPNEYFDQRFIEIRKGIVANFCVGLLFFVVGVSQWSLGFATLGLVCMVLDALLYKLYRATSTPMMKVDAEGFVVDMKAPTGLCTCELFPASKFTWDQVESLRVVAFKARIYEGSDVKSDVEMNFHTGTQTTTTTTTYHYRKEVVSMLAVTFKSPKPDDQLLCSIRDGSNPTVRAQGLDLQDTYDVDLVISGLAPLFAPDDKDVNTHQARDTEYVLECFQKFLPDKTLPPLYGIYSAQGMKVVVKWDLLSEYSQRLDLPVDQRDWNSYGN
jgi:hypothetical protein